MKMKLALLFGSIFCVVLNAQTFTIVEGSFTWHEAKADAESRGGRLAVLNTQTKINLANSIVNSNGNSGNPWIGLTDEAIEAEWRWIDGSILNTHNWGSGEPNNGYGTGEDYAFMYGSSSRWNDEPASRSKSYLFEYDDSLTFTLSGEGTEYSVTNCDSSASGSLEIPSSYNGLPVTSIGVSALGFCSALTSVTVPGSVTSIGDAAFGLCTSLTSITFEGDAPTFGLGVFSGSSSVTVYYNSNYSGWSSTVAGRPAVDTVPTESLTFALNGDSSEYSVSDCDSSTQGSFDIPSTYYGLPVTSIGDSAFYDCSSITSITIPDSVTSIGNSAFSGLGLTSITIGDSVTSIEDYAFFDTYNLVTITIPNSVTSIATDAFSTYGGTRAISITFEGDAPAGALSLDEGSVAYYYSDAQGFTSPAWQGIQTVMLPRDTTPRVAVLDLESFYESNSGEDVTINARPTDGYPLNYTYQWYINEVPIPSFLGGTNETYTIDGALDREGTWKVYVTNDSGMTSHSFEYRVFADADGDGLSDYRESNITSTNPNIADSDDDGLNDGAELLTNLTDPFDADSDDDGLNDGAEVNASNSTDPLDADSDDDGLTDYHEVVTYLSNPNSTDSDADTLLDYDEIYTHSTNPNSADSDTDGLSDADEINTYSTDPNDADSDDDGLSDGDEVSIALNPLSNDSDSDGLLDGVETNTAEYIDATDTGTDPNDSDTDNDGLLDGAETNTNVYVSSSDTGTHPLNTDSDADGYSDYVETNTGTWNSSDDTGTDPNRGDTDNDGIIDGRETNTGIFVSTTNTGTNPFNADSDGDGFSDQFEVNTSYDPTSASDTPDALTVIRSAVEIDIYAADGGVYRVEYTEDLDSDIWITVEDGIIGNGEIIHRLYSVREYTRRFFRAIRTDQ